LTLTRRIILTALLTLAGLWAVLHVSSRLFLVRGFLDLEREALNRKVERAQAAVEDSVHALATQAENWAVWDDTYAFLGDDNQGYRRANLGESSFETLRIDLLVIRDVSGRVVHARWRPGPDASPAEVPPAALDQLLSVERGSASPGEAMSIAGLTVVNAQPMLLAARSVLTSGGEGPSRGTLTMGRWLNGPQTQRIERLTGASVRVIGASPMPGAMIGDDVVTGVADLACLRGGPAARIAVSIPRDIFRAGERITRYLELALTIGCGLFTGALALFIHVCITRRVVRLGRVVDDIARGSPGAARVPVGAGDDEIARLARNVNELLKVKHEHETKLALRARELQVARLQAEAASNAKSGFLANMSHEIRTPMTAILGYADLLVSDDGTPAPPSVHAEAVSTIRRNGEHLLNVINDILDLSKIEAGRMTTERLECRPLELIEEVRELMALRAAASKLSVELVVGYPVPETIVTDPVRVRQILVNLLSNAIKFTPAPPGGPGRITVRVESPAEPDGTRTLRVSVADTGPGITDELRSRLFTPFTQQDQTTTRKFGGTGLGLAISRQLAGLLGGSLTCPRNGPEQPRGAVFVLTLPVPAGAALLHAAPEPARLCVQRASSTTGLSGRVLLAEDGVDNQRLLKHVLTASGASVRIVDTGAKALAAWTEDPSGVDLVLMDMQMPEMDGYEATVALRQAGYAGPIIALTADAMAGTRERCLQAGCDDYLTKPLDRALLLMTCRRWLTTPREPGAGASAAGRDAEAGKGG
jgi:signal transduction histidine kinase/CheY-like chemotaxis protein